MSWVPHPGTNCYSGFGATDIQGMSPGPRALSLDECKAACEAHSDCEGFIMPAGQHSSGLCFLRKDLDLGSCLAWKDWDLWARA